MIHTISVYDASEKNALLHHIDGARFVHHHLDWVNLPERLQNDQTDSIVLAKDRWGNIIGCIALSPPIERTSWVRLITIKDSAETFTPLWDAVMSTLRPQLSLIALMSNKSWLIEWIGALGFRLEEQVIGLIAHASKVDPDAIKVQIRSAKENDLQTILAIDHRAFAPLWRLRQFDLDHTYPRSFYMTLANPQGEDRGYLMALNYGATIHLGRLAILPPYQNQGIARSLVADLMRYAYRINDSVTFTVNTQISNYASRRVYESLGFKRDYGDIPIYMLRL